MKVRKEQENSKESGPTMSHTFGNGSGSSTSAESQSLHIERSGSRGPADKKATGPRTRQGKEKSKHNATRHGIFSSAVVTRGESQAEFDGVLNGLREDRQPVGKFEELLLDKLASDFWRLRRVLIAEAAEIQAQAESVAWNGKERIREEAAGLSQFNGNRGLIRRISNRAALLGCLDLLEELKGSIQERGFSLELDKIPLAKLYGDYDGENSFQTLFRSYLLWCSVASISPEERQQEGLPPPDKCKDVFLGEVKQEIKRLRQYEKKQAKFAMSQLALDVLRQIVPDVPKLDLLLRYNTHLERNIDRTWNQLERAQRMRLGQPVPPQIDVKISPS
jgi:hypothetical protein